MRLLRAIVRRVLAEAAKGVDDIPGGHYVEVKMLDSSTMTIMLLDPRGRALGEVGLKRPEGIDGPCAGAWIVSASHAEHGWGPLLYDIAIEWASREGPGLTPDRFAVSDDAFNIWQYYLTRRPDVKSHQLDSRERTLGLDDDDACAQDTLAARLKKSYSNDLSAEEIGASPISKYYSKSPTTIQALKRAGKLRVA